MNHLVITNRQAMIAHLQHDLYQIASHLLYNSKAAQSIIVMIPDTANSPVLQISVKQNELSTEIRKIARDQFIQKRRQHNKQLAKQQPTISIEPQLEQTQDKVHTAKRGHRRNQRQIKEKFEEVLLNLSSQNPDLTVHAISILKKLICMEQDPPIQQIIDYGLVPLIIHCASQNQNEAVKLDASWILLNICTGTDKQVMCIIEKGFLRLLGEYLHSPNVIFVQNAIWSMANIAAESNLINLLTASPIIEQVISAVERIPSTSIAIKAAWCISNFFRSKISPPLSQQRIRTCTPILMNALALITEKSDTYYQILWGLSYVSNLKAAQETLMREESLAKFQEVLSADQNSAITGTLKILAGLCSNKHNCEKVFSEKVYHVLGDLIFSSNKRVKEFLLTLIMKGCQFSDQVASALANTQKSMRQLIKMSECEEPSLLVLVVTIFKNMALILPFKVSVSVFVMYQVMRSLALNLISSNSQVTVAVLNALTSIFELCEPRQQNPFLELFNRSGGSNLLQKLQEHSSDQIYTLSLSILETYYVLQDSIR